MGNKITVNTHGSGSVSFGNVVQGDANRVGDMASIASIEVAIQAAKNAVERLTPPGTGGHEAAVKVAEHLEEFGAEARQANRSEARGSKILQVIRENFSWAYPALKDLVTAVWPAHLAIL